MGTVRGVPSLATVLNAIVALGLVTRETVTVSINVIFTVYQCMEKQQILHVPFFTAPAAYEAMGLIWVTTYVNIIHLNITFTVNQHRKVYYEPVAEKCFELP